MFDALACLREEGGGGGGAAYFKMLCVKNPRLCLKLPHNEMI